MTEPVLTDQRLAEEIEPVLEAFKPGSILRTFFLQWVILGAFIGFGVVWASEIPWSSFHPSAAWLLTVILGSGTIAGGTALFRIWSVRRYLTRTNDELRGQLSKDWSLLTRPGWVGRIIRYSVAASMVAGVSMGTLLSIRFPGDRFLGSTLATIGAMTMMFLAPMVPVAFGGRALFVRKITQRVEEGLVIGESPSSGET